MPQPGEKNCSTCGLRKDDAEFYPGAATCKECKLTRAQQASNENQNRYLGRLCAQAKRQARRRNLEFNVVPGHLEDLWRKQAGRCALSGIIMTHHRDGLGTKDFNASIDRINGAIGYTNNNVQLACLRANLMRSTLSGTEFNWWVRTISDHMTVL